MGFLRKIELLKRKPIFAALQKKARHRVNDGGLV
jgi:hypothetical protein